MPVNDQQFNVQQDRVKKLAESYEGAEKKEVAELYVERIAKLKSAIMESSLTDSQKEDYLKRLDNYLKLVDANNLERLRKEYEPLLRSMESTLGPEVKEPAKDDREAQLEDVVDLKIRQELLGEWRETTKFKEKYDSKRQQIDLLIKTKKLAIEGTELQYYMTSIDFHTDFISSKFKEYYATKDVGQKHQRLKDIMEQSETFFEVLTEVEKRLQTVNSQDDLRLVDLNDRNVLAEQAMFVKRKRYESAKQEFLKKLDAMKIPKNDPVRKRMDMTFQAADTQFETFKETVMVAKDRETRTVAAEEANRLLDQAISVIDGANKYLGMVDVKDASMRGLSATKIFEQAPALKKIASTVPIFIMPQFAVGLGYYEAAHKGSSGTDTALEVADFGISLIPFAGGAYDIFASIRGKTLSGREMGTAERVVRGVIGLGSIVLDIFTFGVGGSLLKAGGKAAIQAGAKITAKATAKAALEAGGKVAAKEAAEAGGKILAKEGAEAGGKIVAEGLAKEAGEAATKEIVEGAAKEASAKVTVALTEAQKEIVFKGTQAGASAAERSAAREVLREMVTKSLESSAKELGAKHVAKLAEQTAKIATRKTTGVAGWAYGKMAGFTGGRFGEAGVRGLEAGIVRAGTEKAGIDAALQAGKEVGMGYYVQAKFVREGEVLWGAMGKEIAKESGKAFLHLHNPLEILRTLQRPVQFMSKLVRRVPRNMFQDKAALLEIEQSAKATLIADGHSAKELEVLFKDVKEKPWQQFLKENENNPILKDPDVREFFKGFQEQFPKSFSTQVGAVTDLYKSFKELEPDAVASAHMAYDSRRMEWPEFYKKYQNNLRNATPEQLKAFEDQFKNLHSLNRDMPVNVARLKEERAAVALTEEQVKKLRSELAALEKEKAELEGVVQQYKDKVASAEKGGKALTEAEKEQVWYTMFEKLPDGPLKKAAIEKRDALMKDMGIDVKVDTPEFKKYSAQALEGQVEFRLSDVEKRMAAKIDEVGVAKIELDAKAGAAKSKSSPGKLEQKGDVVALGDKRAAEATELMALDAQRKLIKKIEQEMAPLRTEKAEVDKVLARYEELLKKKQTEAGTELLSKEQEAEVWFQVYGSMGSASSKREIDKLIRTNLNMPKKGTVEYERRVGEISKGYMVDRHDKVETLYREKVDELAKAKGNPIKPDDLPPSPPMNDNAVDSSIPKAA